ncbi:MAG: rod shape-determining protein MreD [Candidatus Eisenbacteria bacterium]|nr:rod shape-determining protein MreD [Candidatus Eisenbacteria bacterium]
MRLGAFIVLALLAVVLNSVLVPRMEILGARPDLLVLVVAYASLALGARPAIVLGFVMGLIADAEHPEYLGLHALSLSLIGYASAVAWERLVRGSIFVQCSVVFAATIVHDAIYYAVYYRNYLDIFWRFVLRFSLAGALYTAVFGAIVFGLARVQRWRSIAGG